MMLTGLSGISMKNICSNKIYRSSNTGWSMHINRPHMEAAECLRLFVIDLSQWWLKPYTVTFQNNIILNIHIDQSISYMLYLSSIRSKFILIFLFLNLVLDILCTSIYYWIKLITLHFVHKKVYPLGALLSENCA